MTLHPVLGLVLGVALYAMLLALALGWWP